MSDSDVKVEADRAPGLVKQGLDVYKALEADMARAMGLGAYGEKLKYTIQVLCDINQHLSKEQKKLKEELDIAYRKTNKGIAKARYVVSLIKEQAGILAMILGEYSHGNETEKMFAACVVFSDFAKKVDSKLDDAEQKLQDASELLDKNMTAIEGIVDTLEGVQRNIVAKMEAEIAKQRGLAYGLTAAIAILSTVLAPAVLAIGGPIAIAVTEAKTVPELVSRFGSERDKIRGYIGDFKSMNKEVAALKASVDAKRTMLQDINAKTNTLGDLAGGRAVRFVPITLLPTIRGSTNDLVVHCTTFLQAHPLE